MPPRSKRQRKQKDLLSLRSKKGNLSTNQQHERDGDILDTNAFILPEARGGVGDDNLDDAGPPPAKLSKSQQRKLRRVQEEKERRARREEVLATLSQHQMDSEKLGLLLPASARGQKESKKQALRRALQLEKAGVDLPEGVQLYKERRTGRAKDVDEMANSESDDGESEEESSGDELETHPAATRQPVALGTAASKLSTESDSDVDSDDGPIRSAKKQRKESSASDQPEASAAAQAQALRAAVAAAKAELGKEGAHNEEEDVPMPDAGRVPASSGPARVVLVQRPPEIDAVRVNLPIVGMEQEVMEAIAQNDVIMLCGETGCGKTTQVPQFLYEAGYGSPLFPERAGVVGVTQPRRVAAVSTATRVAEELGTRLGDVVGYQVRYDKRVGTSTALKFMTDGILLREVQEDFLLRKYSALVVDEAHERSLNTDILLGMLSRIVTLRRSMAAQSAASGGTAASSDSVQPLKLIVMSATLRTEDFVSNQRLFPQPPPVVSVPARQYPVTVHFSKRTEVHDYVGAAYKKVCQIHRNLPPGGVLVFLTGQREVEYLCRKLRKTFATRKAKQAKHGELETPADLEEGEAAAGDWSGGDAAEADAGAAADEAMLLAALEDDRSAAGEAVDDYADESSGDEEEVVVMGGDGFSPEEIAEAENKFSALLGVGGPNGAQIGAGGEEGGQEEAEPAGRVLVLPLYAMLPPAQQALVFKPPPEGHRLIVVATNVAETSLTIPGVRYVVDAGRSKQKLLESAAGLSRFEVRWVSKASAEQRAGRAGRTGPGHCYRLYSSAHFNDTFPQHSPPEVVNTALEGVTLMLKSLGVDKVANFPFPSPPEASGLRAAERCLVALGALDPGSKKLTHAGKEMARFPISPRHARMLLQALEVARSAGTAGDVDDVPHGKKGKKKSGKSIDPGVLLQYAAALAAVLSVESPFVSISNMAAEEKVDDEADPRNDGSAQGGSKADDAAVKEERKRQLQSAREAHARFRTADSDALSALRVLCAFEAAGEVESFCRDNFLHFRNLREAAALRKQLSKLIVTQQQVKEVTFALSLTAPPSPPPVVALEALRRALAAGWCDQVARRVRSVEHIKSRTSDGKKGRAVRYRSCALEEDVFLHPNSALHASAPELVTYTELVRTVKRPYMAGVTAIEPQWLSALAAPMCTFSAPLIDPAPFYSVTADAVLAWREVTFGQYDWPLPRHAAPHPELSERAATFAAALLEGKILPSMAALRAAMAVPPSMAARPDMRMHKRVAELLAALERAHVDSKAALAAQWRRNPEFLKREMAQWLQKGGAGVLESVWHSLLRESGAVAE